jgi:hypothetical protein
LTHKGFLDRLRENLVVLDESIETARRMSKKKDARALQWSKNLRELIELRNTTLEKVKIHLLGRDETGASNEPPDIYISKEDGEPTDEFEHLFEKFLSRTNQSQARKSETTKRSEVNQH